MKANQGHSSMILRVSSTLILLGALSSALCSAQTASGRAFQGNTSGSSTTFGSSMGNSGQPNAAASQQSPTASMNRNARQNNDGRLNNADEKAQTKENDQKALLPPPPPSEFQLLVESTTGKLLPIFGANLFRGVPSTFAPVDNIPVTPDYTIGPGDELRIQIYGQVNDNITETVDRSGQISLPTIGPVHVAGVSFSHLRDFLISQLSRVNRNFDLNVNLGQLRSIQVFVVGQAQKPGSYSIGSLSTLLNALFASGGPTPQGSLRDIQVLRESKVITHFDLYDLLLHGDKSHDIRLQSGDVLYIPNVGRQVAVLGSVNTPAIYELRGATTFSQAITMAGGPTSVAAVGQVRVDRVADHRERSVLDVNASQLDDAANPVENGDIVSVSSILNKFNNAVTLRGNVTNPGRYEWHSGMRLLDLIPTKSSLITRNYYDRTDSLAHDTADYSTPPLEGQIATAPGAIQHVTGSHSGANAANGSGAPVSQTLAVHSDNFRPQTDVFLQAPDVNWDYAVIQRQSKKDLTISLVPFNPGKLLIDHDMSQNLELEPGDVVTIFSKADVRGPAVEQTRYVHLEGEFVAAGVYSALPRETLRQLIQRVGGFTSDAYLYGSQFTRISTQRLQKQRLDDYADALDAQISSQTSAGISSALTDRDAAAAQSSADIAHAVVNRLRQATPTGRIVMDLKYESAGIDAVPDIELENGDRFIVPKAPSNVAVEGQVYSANAFIWKSHETAKSYLAAAGGPDRSADKHREYILRADGSVVGGGYGAIKGKRLYPGDTVVVPPIVQKGSLLRQLADVSSILSGFGLAAAAINVLK
ncbi:MAG: SLBB domain-containing protein [Acidobacteriaceae bacterium]